MLSGLIAAWLGQQGAAPGAPRLTWELRPASNTVVIRLLPGTGPLGRSVLAQSWLTVSEAGPRHLTRRSLTGGHIRIPVPPGRQTRLRVRVDGPQPFRQTLTVTVPPALRVARSRNGPHGLLLRLSAPLRRSRPTGLCRTSQVSYPAPSEIAVAKSPQACHARLTLTARNGEQAVVPVTIPGLPKVPLYSFASPAGRAIYITVDDGWTPSRRVLAIMRRTRLPVTAFLIEQAARRNLGFWRAFVRAGGTIGDHTVSHPNLTRQALSGATAQWGQARQVLGRWLGRPPLMGRPPYGAVDASVEAAAYRGGLKVLAGWSATADHGIRTWDGKRLEPGEIVLLHWVPGLGQQLTRLLTAIRARNLHPMPLTPASFTGIAPQRHSLSGD